MPVTYVSSQQALASRGPAADRIMVQSEQRLHRLRSWFNALDRPQTVVLATAMLLIIVLADGATGWRVRFTMFYILPVLIAAWKLGFAPGLVFGSIAAFAGSLVNAGGAMALVVAHIPLWIWDVGARLTPLAIVAWLVDRLHRTIESERRLARTDALTGALNRRAVLEEAARALAQGERLGLATGFLYIDLDGFKAVNDQQGHGVGDELLVKFVEAAKAAVRRGDLVARVGGDEFVLLLAGASMEGAEGAARRVCGELRALAATWQPPVSFCAGLCLVGPGALQDGAVAIDHADRMMYTAKHLRTDTDWFQAIHLSSAPLAPRAA